MDTYTHIHTHANMYAHIYTHVLTVSLHSLGVRAHNHWLAPSCYTRPVSGCSQRAQAHHLPPFADDDNDAVLFEKIKKGNYDADDPIWEHISVGAKDAVARLLTVDTRKRMSAAQALVHPWIDKGIRYPSAPPQAAAGVICLPLLTSRIRLLPWLLLFPCPTPLPSLLTDSCIALLHARISAQYNQEMKEVGL